MALSHYESVGLDVDVTLWVQRDGEGREGKRIAVWGKGKADLRYREWHAANIARKKEIEE